MSFLSKLFVIKQDNLTFDKTSRCRAANIYMGLLHKKYQLMSVSCEHTYAQVPDRVVGKMIILAEMLEQR